MSVVLFGGFTMMADYRIYFKDPCSDDFAYCNIVLSERGFLLRPEIIKFLYLTRHRQVTCAYKQRTSLLLYLLIYIKSYPKEANLTCLIAGALCITCGYMQIKHLPISAYIYI